MRLAALLRTMTVGRVRLLHAWLFAPCAFGLAAQPVIDSTAAPVAGSTYVYLVGDQLSLPGTGAGQVWDASMASTITTDSIAFIDTADASGAFAFPLADVARKALGRETFLLADADGVGHDGPVLPSEQKQPHRGEVDHDSLPGGIGQDKHEGKQHAAAVPGRPDIRIRVGRGEGLVAETEVSRNVRQRVALPDRDHGQLPDDLLALRCIKGMFLDAFVRLIGSGPGPEDPPFRGHGTGLKE